MKQKISITIDEQAEEILAQAQFREEEFLEEDFEDRESWHMKAKPEYSKGLIAQYKFFGKNVYSPRKVFYPCCNIDASPVKAFPNSEVILMDEDQEVDYVMKKHKVLEFIQGEVLEYQPKNSFDLVIILNPQLRSLDLTKHLISGGYALANNWHDNASELLENPEFEGLGTIARNKKGLYLRKDFDKLEPNQWDTYFYVFRKGKELK